MPFNITTQIICDGCGKTVTTKCTPVASRSHPLKLHGITGICDESDLDENEVRILIEQEPEIYDKNNEYKLACSADCTLTIVRSMLTRKPRKKRQ